MRVTRVEVVLELGRARIPLSHGHQRVPHDQIGGSACDNLERRLDIPDNCWKWGIFYVNPDDPAVFVRKRYGLGYTLNFANRWSWAAVALIALAIILPLSVPMVLMHTLRHRMVHQGG
jgi:uncharacterized protein DUF5808